MTATAVVFPDVEELLCTVLPPLLVAEGLAHPVGTRVPNPRPAAFWRVLATGGDHNNRVQDAATVTIESWANTETQASLMARTARAVLESLAGTVSGSTVICRGRDFGAPVNLPDPTTGQVRYTSTGALYLRGVQL